MTTRIRNAWYVGEWSDELPTGSPKPIVVMDEPIVLWRSASGVEALADRCPHRLAPLSSGRCEGEAIRCLFHGILFNGAGQAMEIPGQSVIPEAMRVRAYPVHEAYGWIWLWMGDPALADIDEIPALCDPDDPTFHFTRGLSSYAASSDLVCDNFVDSAHLAWVHPETTGRGAAGTNPPHMAPLENGVRMTRWIEATDEVGTDSWLLADLIVPGVLTIETGSFPAGTAIALNHGRPDPAKAVANAMLSAHAVTPVGDRLTRHYYISGIRTAHADNAARKTMAELAARSVDEDRAMIESQQRILDTAPAPGFVPIAADRGITMYRGIVRKLAHAESA